jgi:hypothetical protein
MKIPTMASNVIPMPTASARGLTGPSEAAAEAGQMISRMGLSIAEKEQSAQDALELLRSGNELKSEIDRVAETFNGRTDYEKFDDDVGKEIERISKTMGPRKGSLELDEAYQSALSQHAFHLKSAIKSKKYDVMEQLGQIEFGKIYDQGIKEYAAEPDPEKRESIRNEVEMQGLTLGHKYVLKPKYVDDQMRNWETVAEREARRNGMAAVREDALIDAEKTLGRLDSKDYHPELDSLQRVELKEHVEVMSRSENSRVEKTTKAWQEYNQSMAVDEWANGTLTLDKLKGYRDWIPGIERPGLGDTFYQAMVEKLKYGDVDDNNELFQKLYLNPKLDGRMLEKYSDQLPARQYGTLLRVIRSERKEDERLDRSDRRAELVENQREKTEAEREARRDAQVEKERRGRYAADARAFLKKAFNETGVNSDEGAKILVSFQGYVDDKKVPPEELAVKAMELMESKKGGAIRKIWRWFFPDRATKRDFEEGDEPGGGESQIHSEAIPSPIPVPSLKTSTAVFPGSEGNSPPTTASEDLKRALPPQPVVYRKSLDDIFGGNPAQSITVTPTAPVTAPVPPTRKSIHQFILDDWTDLDTSKWTGTEIRTQLRKAGYTNKEIDEYGQR